MSAFLVKIIRDGSKIDSPFAICFHERMAEVLGGAGDRRALRRNPFRVQNGVQSIVTAMRNISMVVGDPRSFALDSQRVDSDVLRCWLRCDATKNDQGCFLYAIRW